MNEKEIRIIDKKELRKLVPYSVQHIGRLENQGKFPKRVKIGECRVGWVEREVLDWIAMKINDRDSSIS